MYMFDAESDVPARGTIQTRGDGWLIGISDAPARGALLIRGDGSETLNAQRNAAWQLADVDQGLPWISSEVQGEFTAQALGLDRFGAISLNKGCYPGQEIVARLHFRGGNKRACYRVAVLDSLVPAPGTRVHSGTGGTALGTLLYAARVDGQSSRALAVLPADLEIGPDLQLEGGARVEVIARVNRAEPTP
jgi:folate-binding protein YgfZ